MHCDTDRGFVTSGDIADALQRDAGQVRHILSSRRVEPVGRAGLVRLYPTEVIEFVRREGELIDAKRRKVVPA